MKAMYSNDIKCCLIEKHRQFCIIICQIVMKLLVTLQYKDLEG